MCNVIHYIERSFRYEQNLEITCDHQCLSPYDKLFNKIILMGEDPKILSYAQIHMTDASKFCRMPKST
uniref:Uncharacterized protein n=1 Tax=Romanomermis culicivorax TaxID=13658 RepID=A0A915KYJ7_ROMCU